MVCPFCGRESKSDKYCTRCNVTFNDEVRAIAHDENPGSDRIGPFSMKTAKIILWIFMGLLIVAFVLITEFMRF